MNRVCFIFLLFFSLSGTPHSYSIYFSLKDLQEQLVNPSIKRVYECFPGFDIKVEVVRQRSWLGGFIYGEESTRPMSLARLALVYLVGGATFSYLTVAYLIYRVYQIIKIIYPLIKHGVEDTYVLSEKEIQLIETYMLSNEWLKKRRLRYLFQYNQKYEDVIEAISHTFTHEERLHIKLNE